MSMWSSHIPNLDFKLVLPVLCGRENDEDEGNDGQPGEGGAGAGEQKAADSSAAAGDNDSESQGDPQKKITAQNEIIARKQAALEAKETELEELRKFRQGIEDAKLSEKEKVDKRIKELEESSNAKDATLQKLVIHNAFLAANDVSWHDAETALSLLDTSGFEIVNDGNSAPSVKDKVAFSKAIAKLAADKPYLVKTPSEDAPAGGPKEWKGKTGDAPKPKQSDEAAEKERLRKKFPALRNRG